MPLRRVESWVGFVEKLAFADLRQVGITDEVLDLASADLIDEFRRRVVAAKAISLPSPALAAASLKDAAADLEHHGLHVLAGQFIGRTQVLHENCWHVETRPVLELAIRHETEVLGHTIDRSREPLSTAEIEETDANDLIDFWLKWEGKIRLFLWGSPGRSPYQPLKHRCGRLTLVPAEVNSA